MPRYLIHIGPHKTGTTYLQHAFTRLRPELAARRIVYPDQWGGPHGHHTLAAKLAQGDDAAVTEAFAHFNRSGSETILLSSEEFSALDEAGVRRLHGLLGSAAATVVFYCRRWSELIPSLWREVIKHGSLATLPEFAASCFADPMASDPINFDLVLGRYAAVFGKRAIRLVSYNAVVETKMDLWTHFCQHFLNWSQPPATGLDRVNESLDMVDTEIIRTLNALEWLRAREERARLYKAYIAAKPDLPVRFIVEQSMQYVVNALRLNDAAPLLAQLHATLLERYRMALVPPFPATGLFKPQSAESHYIRQDYLLVDGMMDTLRAMQATLLRRTQTLA